jgi:hypothetical protein
MPLEDYWFKIWLDEKGVRDAGSLRRALSAKTVDDFLSIVPEAHAIIMDHSPEDSELSAGKGIDLTGILGCRDPECLKLEIDTLFRHIWLYFDKVRVPDQALWQAVHFQNRRSMDTLVNGLEPCVFVVKHLEEIGASDLIVFETRTPSCRDHFRKHASEASIGQSIANLGPIEQEIVKNGEISWEKTNDRGHVDLEYRVDYDFLEHSRWGTICSKRGRLPQGDQIKYAIAQDVIRDFLAELSADALAARRSKTALGATINLYRHLLATSPSSDVADVAFELAIPVADNVSVENLIRIRKSEKPSFERFQSSLRQAIDERLRHSGSGDPATVAREIRETVIEPGVREIRDKLQAAKALAFKSGALGAAMGTAAATVGLMSPIAAGALGVPLAAGGVLMAGGSVVKASTSYLEARRDVSLSDMYFLWKAHGH